MRLTGSVLLLPLLLQGCFRKSPQEAAAAYDVQISDGFRHRGGVTIDSEHVVTDLALAAEVGKLMIRNAEGENFTGELLSSAKAINVGLLYLEDEYLPHAAVGEAAGLAPGTVLTAQLFDKEGRPEVRQGEVIAWRFHAEKAYLQLAVQTTAEDVGTGFFDPNGKLVALHAFTRGQDLTFALPIEYLVNGPQSITSDLLGTREDQREFAAKRAEAKGFPDELPTPIEFSNITHEQTFSATALVGRLFILDKKDSPAHAAPVNYVLEAVDADRNRRTLAKGPLAQKNVQWHTLPEAQQELTAKMTRAFGSAWVRAALTPYEYGELRYRVPLDDFCGQVTDTEVHTLTLSLADGRTSGEIGFSDLINICTRAEVGEGTALEQAWGMQVKAPAAPERKGKKKRRGKAKRKRGRKAKKRRR